MGQRGYSQAWLGGGIGGVVGCVAGFILTDAYFDSHPNLGLQGIGVPFMFIPPATLIGVVAGAWLLLRILRYSRPLLSGIVYSLLLIGFVPAIAGGGSILLPINVGIEAGVVITLLLASLTSAVLARELAGRV